LFIFQFFESHMSLTSQALPPNLQWVSVEEYDNTATTIEFDQPEAFRLSNVSYAAGTLRRFWKLGRLLPPIHYEILALILEGFGHEDFRVYRALEAWERFPWQENGEERIQGYVLPV